jgi:predicted dehydrogenase
MSDVEIVALHDNDPEIVKQRSEATGNPPVYTDYRQMLSEVKPDFVLALGRHSDMAAVAHYLLDQGLPFLLEKPMGLDAAEVRGIARKADAVKGFVAVPLSTRFQPQVPLAKELISKGAFGAISHVSFRLMRPTNARYPAWGAPWMLDPEIAGGGVLRNLGNHGLDLFNYLVGEASNVIAAQVSSKSLGEVVDDYATVMVRSASGIIGNIEVSNLYPQDGTHSVLHISGSDALFSFVDGKVRIVTKDAEETPVLQSPGRPSALMLRETLDRWQRGERPPTDVHDCYNAVRLIDQAYLLAGGS